MISWAEIVIIFITVLLLLIYHVHLTYRVRSSPLTTAIGVTNQLRRDWVQTVMEENRDILTAKDPIVTYDAVAAIVNHGALHYTLGMRGFYFAVVFALWMFGPTWMLIGTIVLITVLYNLDRSA